MHEQLTKQEILNELMIIMGERNIICFSYGQKHKEDDGGFELYERLGNAFALDLAVGMQVSHCDMFLVANSERAPAMRNAYPFLLSLKACNLLIPSSNNFVEDSYRLIVYNNCHHIKKHMSYRLKAPLLDFLPGFQQTLTSISAFVQRHLINNIRYRSALRIEGYFSYSNGGINSIKEKLMSYLYNRCYPLYATQEVVENKLVDMINTLHTALLLFSTENYSSWYSLLELYYQFVVAVFCTERLSLQFQNDHMAFKLDGGLFQLMSHQLTYLAMDIVTPDVLNKHMLLFRSVDGLMLFSYMLFYREITVSPENVVNILSGGINLLSDFVGSNLSEVVPSNYKPIVKNGLGEFLETYVASKLRPLTKRTIKLFLEISASNEVLFKELSSVFLNSNLVFKTGNMYYRLDRKAKLSSYEEFLLKLKQIHFEIAKKLYLAFVAKKLNSSHEHYNFITMCDNLNDAAGREARGHKDKLPVISGNQSKVFIIKNLDKDMLFRCLYATVPVNDLQTQRVHLPNFFSGFQDLVNFLGFAAIISYYCSDSDYTGIRLSKAPKLEYLREKITGLISAIGSSKQYKSATLLLATGAFMAQYRYRGREIMFSDLIKIDLSVSHVTFSSFLPEVERLCLVEAIPGDITSSSMLLSNQIVVDIPNAECSTPVSSKDSDHVILQSEQTEIMIYSPTSNQSEEGNFSQIGVTTYLSHKDNINSNKQYREIVLSNLADVPSINDNYSSFVANTETTGGEPESASQTEGLDLNGIFSNYRIPIPSIPATETIPCTNLVQSVADNIENENKLLTSGKRQKVDEDCSLSGSREGSQSEQSLIPSSGNRKFNQPIISPPSRTLQETNSTNNLVKEEEGVVLKEIVHDSSKHNISLNLTSERQIEANNSVYRDLSPLTKPSRSPYKITANPTVVTEAEFWQLLERHSVLRHHVATFRGLGIDIACLIEFDSTSLIQYLENDLSLSRIVAASIHNFFKQYKIL